MKKKLLLDIKTTRFSMKTRLVVLVLIASLGFVTRISAKIQLLDVDHSIGRRELALLPFVVAPTDTRAVGKKKFSHHRLYVNVGTRLKKRESLGSFVSDDEVTYDVGNQHQPSKVNLVSENVELQALTTLCNFFSDEISSPLEAYTILKKNLSKTGDLHAYIGAGMGPTNRFGSPDFLFTAGITVSLNGRHHESVASKP